MRGLFFALIFMGFSAYAQEAASEKKNNPEPHIVEASCGQCNFGMKGGGCSLAVKIDDKAYFVDGVNLHDVGDAHAADGMCNVVRKAEVEGSIVNDRFQASSFKLLPQEKSNKSKQ